ncbi:MAG TPA: threonine synthase, partial [Candidatus Ratteibacteria bacterium]|nr:threonine synthase [Candidatus Ratteibacteria bacterium]
SSNAMNVGHPSNFARLIDIYGGWIMDERDKEGKVIKYGVMKRKPDIEKMRNDFISFSISNEEVDETIKKYYQKYKIVIEPHTAVGIKSYEKSQINSLVVVFQTADPAKFPEKIKQLLNIEPEIPQSLAKILTKKEDPFDVLENNYDTFKKYILEKLK